MVGGGGVVVGGWCSERDSPDKTTPTLNDGEEDFFGGSLVAVVVGAGASVPLIGQHWSPRQQHDPLLHRSSSLSRCTGAPKSRPGSAREGLALLRVCFPV